MFDENLLDSPVFEEKDYTIFSEASNNESPRSAKESLVQRYPRLIDEKKARIINLRKKMMKQKNREEEAECTFRPKINSEMTQQYLGEKKRTIDDLFQWKKSIHKKKLENEIERLERLENQRNRYCSKNSQNIIKRQNVYFQDRSHTLGGNRKRQRVEERLILRNKMKNKKIRKEREKLLEGYFKPKILKKRLKLRPRLSQKIHESDKENIDVEEGKNNRPIDVIKKLNKEGNKLWTYHFDNMKKKKKSEKKKKKRRGKRRSFHRGKGRNLFKGEQQRNTMILNLGEKVKKEKKIEKKNKIRKNSIKRDIKKQKALEKKIAELRKLEACKEELSSVDTNKRSNSIVSNLSNCTIRKRIPLKGFELNKIYSKVKKTKKNEIKKKKEIFIDEEENKRMKEKERRDRLVEEKLEKEILEAEKNILLEKEKDNIIRKVLNKEKENSESSDEKRKLNIMAERLKKLKHSLEKEQSYQQLEEAQERLRSLSKASGKSRSISHKISVSKKSRKSYQRKPRSISKHNFILNTPSSSGTIFPRTAIPPSRDTKGLRKSRSFANNMIMNTISYTNIFETEPKYMEKCLPKAKTVSKQNSKHIRSTSDLTHYQKTLQEYCQEKIDRRRLRELKRVEKLQEQYKDQRRNREIGESRVSGEISFYEEEEKKFKRNLQDEYSVILSKRNASNSKKEICVLDSLINKKIKDVEKLNRNLSSVASSLSRKKRDMGGTPGLGRKKVELLKEYENLLADI